MSSPPSLLTVTLNPAVDRNYVVSGFDPGGVSRADSVRVTAGGKGINVARVWQTLGGRAVATGFAGGASGERLRSMLAAEGIAGEFVEIAGETRTCLAVTDPDASREFVINEPGPPASQAEQDRFLTQFSQISGGFDFIAICGSAALGVRSEYYASLVEIARRGPAKILLDAWGENLRAGAAAGPHIVKPNRHEATAIGANIASWPDAPAEASKVCREWKLEAVLISGGGDGAVVATRNGAWMAASPKIEVSSTLGCGDSMTAGFLWGLSRTPNDPGEALRWGIAAGAANALTQGAGWMAIRDIETMWGRIEANKMG